MNRRPGRPRKPVNLEDFGAVLTAEEAAMVLRTDKGHVYELIHQRRLRAIRLGRAIKIPKVAMEELLRGGGEAANGATQETAMGRG